jgi:phytoene synthase
MLLQQLRDRDVLLQREARQAQRAGLIMAEVYQAVLNEVERSGCHVLRERVSLTPTYKLWLAIKAWLKN